MLRPTFKPWPTSDPDVWRRHLTFDGMKVDAMRSVKRRSAAKNFVDGEGDSPFIRDDIHHPQAPTIRSVLIVVADRDRPDVARLLNEDIKSLRPIPWTNDQTRAPKDFVQAARYIKRLRAPCREKMPQVVGIDVVESAHRILSIGRSVTVIRRESRRRDRPASQVPNTTVRDARPAHCRRPCRRA